MRAHFANGDMPSHFANGDMPAHFANGDTTKPLALRCVVKVLIAKMRVKKFLDLIPKLVSIQTPKAFTAMLKETKATRVAMDCIQSIHTLRYPHFTTMDKSETTALGLLKAYLFAHRTFDDETGLVQEAARRLISCFEAMCKSLSESWTPPADLDKIQMDLARLFPEYMHVCARSEDLSRLRRVREIKHALGSLYKVRKDCPPELLDEVEAQIQNLSSAYVRLAGLEAFWRLHRAHSSWL